MTTNHTDVSTPRPHARIIDGSADNLSAPTPGELVATQDSAQAGLIVYWSASGDVDYSELLALWADAGGAEEHLPAKPTPAAALRNTAQRLAIKHRLMARPLKGAKRARKGAGWALVREDNREALESPASALPGDVDDNRGIGTAIELPPDESVAPLAYDVVAVLRLTDEGSLTVARATPEMLADAGVQYGYYREHITPRDLAGWLPGRIFALDGVTVRPTGGVYFLPQSSREVWGTIARALTAASGHRLYGIPVMPAEATAVAFLDAMEREAEVFAEKAVEDMPGLGALGRKNRLESADLLIGKLGRYEVLFGEGRLAKARETLEKLRTAGIIAAIVPPPEEAV